MANIWFSTVLTVSVPLLFWILLIDDGSRSDVLKKIWLHRVGLWEKVFTSQDDVTLSLCHRESVSS